MEDEGSEAMKTYSSVFLTSVGQRMAGGAIYRERKKQVWETSRC